MIAATIASGAGASAEYGERREKPGKVANRVIEQANPHAPNVMPSAFD